MKYGYARVSTDGQSVTAQVAELAKAGCRKVFRETATAVLQHVVAAAGVVDEKPVAL